MHYANKKATMGIHETSEIKMAVNGNWKIKKNEIFTWQCGKELMSQDELAVMDGGKCILQLRGVRPFLSDKYDITRHPNFKYTADADKRNIFDIEAFLSARLKLKPDEVCDVYEVDTEGV